MPQEILTAFPYAKRVFVFTISEHLTMLTFLFNFAENKNNFSMKHLTLLQLLFALALVCKWAKVGNFTTLSWYWVFAPLVLHYLIRFLYWYAEIINLKKTVDEEVIHYKAKRQLKKTDAMYKKAVELFKEDLKNEN